MRWFWWSFAFAVVVICDTRKHRRYNEVGIVNEAEANIRIRCQSLRSDQNDVFLGIGNQFRFRFHDIDLGNRHFWCDVYGLFGLDETFDVFGRAAPSRSNVTCFQLVETFTRGIFQIALMSFLVVLYGILESEGFLISPHAFRPIIGLVATFYIGGAISASIGSAWGRSWLISLHSCVLCSIMFLTDAVAVGVVFIMAVGNRCDLIENLPGRLVNEDKFYAHLGPFWMYLGAFLLHITVAVNMAFLQVFNDSILHCKECMKEKTSQLTTSE